jgi:hypothetical protein
MNEKQKYFEYLLSRHYLKRLLEAKLISYAEFDEIDRLNKGKFLCYQSQNQKHKKS